MIAPFERIFAEGFIYRQAADRPRSLVTVLGVWFIFGMFALGGLIFIVASFQSTGVGLGSTVVGVVFGGIMLAFSLVMIRKTTRNYLNRHEIDHETDA
jgi:uncharacterized membrane protein YraQ (UPF0718 family)